MTRRRCDCHSGNQNWSDNNDVAGVYSNTNNNFNNSFDNNFDDNDVAGAFGNNNDPETIYRPTRNIVRTNTNRRTRRVIHPTHIKNVNRNILRVENFFPVTESTVNKNIVEEFNCGSDVNNPCCRPVNNCRCRCRGRCRCRCGCRGNR